MSVSYLTYAKSSSGRLFMRNTIKLERGANYIDETKYISKRKHLFITHPNKHQLKIISNKMWRRRLSVWGKNQGMPLHFYHNLGLVNGGGVLQLNNRFAKSRCICFGTGTGELLPAVAALVDRYCLRVTLGVFDV